MISWEHVPENSAQALIFHMEELIHDLGQPLLVIRFAAELLSSRAEMMSKEELSTKIALISQAIDQSNGISRDLSEDLQKLKKFL